MYSWGGDGGDAHVLGLHPNDRERHVSRVFRDLANNAGDGRIPLENTGVYVHAVVPSPIKSSRLDALNRKVTMVACGAMHSCVCCADGSCWTWGSGNGGRLGHGSNVDDQMVPKQVVRLRHEAVKEVHCSRWHTAAVVLPPPLTEPVQISQSTFSD